MSSSRPSMTTKPVQGYQIIDDGLVWYPIADDSQANNVFMNTYEQQLVITNITGTYTFKTPADYFAALTKRHIHSEQTLYLEMLKVIRQRIAADEFKQALLATQNGYLYCDFYAEGDSVWDGGKGSQKRIIH
jgi:hypothetical protein